MNIQLVSLLITHFLCNAQAAQQLMSVEEATYCSLNFEAAKTLIHPDITQSESAQLSDSQRMEERAEAYFHYRSWLSQHPDLVVRLKDAAEKIASPPTTEARN